MKKAKIILRNDKFELWVLSGRYWDMSDKFDTEIEAVVRAQVEGYELEEA